MTLRRLHSVLRSLGLSPRKKSLAAAARRATVRDLAFNCSDEEIARFDHTNPGRVRKDRVAMKLPNKYGNKQYHRPYSKPITRKMRNKWDWTQDELKRLNQWRSEPGITDPVLA